MHYRHLDNIYEYSIGTKHAQTAGFHLESLTKLDGTKTNDQTLNLMNFIVEIVEETDPDLMKFVLELEEVRKAAKVNDENLRGQIRNISNSIDEIKQELKHYSDDSKIDSYERYHKVIYWIYSTKFGNFRANLVEFWVEKGPFLFVTHCYIRAFSG